MVNTKRRSSLPIALLGLFLGLMLFNFMGCEPGIVDPPPPPPSEDSTAYFAFRNATTTPPDTYHGPVFELSHNYPQALPAGGDSMPWLQINVDFDDPNPVWAGNTAWQSYLQSIFDYVREGQDPNLTNEAGWKVDVNAETRWYHVPWMAYDSKVGREFAHGCTSERIADVEDLDGDGDLEPSESSGTLPLADGKETPKKFETWAVGMYNDYAGYAIGQAFPASGAPEFTELNGRKIPKGLPFPIGSCVVKTLFTVADSTDAYYLRNAPTWNVDRHVVRDGKYQCERAVNPVQLVQMDVAVADPRSPTKWVFATFVYDGTLPGATAWDRIVPLGVQFGNDPEVFPAVADTTATPKQSILNKSLSIYEHYGCHGRLAGPVDNKLASCMSCHGGAYTAPMDQLDTMGMNIPQIFYFATMCTTPDEENKAYFSNRSFPEPYMPDQFVDAISTDYSLQLSVAMTQYKVYTLQHHSNPCTPSSAE